MGTRSQSRKLSLSDMGRFTRRHPVASIVIWHPFDDVIGALASEIALSERVDFLGFSAELPGTLEHQTFDCARLLKCPREEFHRTHISLPVDGTDPSRKYSPSYSILFARING